jgi:hypothetical protein
MQNRNPTRQLQYSIPVVALKLQQACSRLGLASRARTHVRTFQERRMV